MTSITQKIGSPATYNIAQDIYVLDDIVPDWLHKEAVKTLPHIALGFGHRGLGPYQGYQFWSDQWGDADANKNLDEAPWQLTAIWTVLNENKKRISPNVGNIQLNQIQIKIKWGW